MENGYGFDVLLMIGVVKALREMGLLTEREQADCISEIESGEYEC